MSLKEAGKLFIRTDVQTILKSLTGFNLDKIYAPRYNQRLRKSRIELLTDRQLEHYRRGVINKASKLLQMPPFLPPREPCDSVICEDKALNMLNTQNTSHIFIDISLNVPNTKRLVVVRETNGRLRHANWEERERMLQIFYPVEGRSFYMPKMFEPDNLENCLKEKSYQMILDKACIQFEPHDPEFIRVTHRTYEYINQNRDYEYLKSSRFYGPMVFYLAWYKKLNNLIVDALNKSILEDCLNIVKLYYILYPDSSSLKLIQAPIESVDTIELLKVFIMNELFQNAEAELALNNYIESTKTQVESKN